MNNLNSLVTDNDIWTIAEGPVNGDANFLLRFRPNLQDFIATKKYNKRLTIIWNYEPVNSSLMPNDEDTALMTDVENALVDILENDLQAILAFVYTGDSQKEWHWYSSDIGETGNRLNEALSNFDVLPLELLSEDDPDWNEYNEVLESTEGKELDEEDAEDE
jgi:Family of unknown function (DUF695)